MVTKSELGDEIAGFFSNVSQKKHRRFVHLMKMSHILRLKKNTDWTGQNDHRVNANLKMAFARFRRTVDAYCFATILFGDGWKTASCLKHCQI